MSHSDLEVLVAFDRPQKDDVSVQEVYLTSGAGSLSTCARRKDNCRTDAKVPVVATWRQSFSMLKTEKGAPEISVLNAGLQTSWVSVLSDPSDLNKHSGGKEEA